MILISRKLIKKVSYKKKKNTRTSKLWSFEYFVNLDSFDIYINNLFYHYYNRKYLKSVHKQCDK